ncbi:hypothetical protein [Shewanella gaetbuli]
MNNEQAMQRALGIVGSESELKAAVAHAKKTGRSDIIQMLSSSDPHAVSLAAEMAARAYKASRAQASRDTRFQNVPVQDLVQPAKKEQVFTARVYAESLQKLRKSGDWDGSDYNHPVVKELGNRMRQNMHTLNTGNVSKSQASNASVLNINEL